MSEQPIFSFPSSPAMEQPQSGILPPESTSDTFSCQAQHEYDVVAPIAMNIAQTQRPGRISIDITITSGITQQRGDQFVSDLSLCGHKLIDQDASKQSRRSSDVSHITRSPPRHANEEIQDYITLITVMKYKPILRELILKASLNLVSKAHYDIPFDPTATEIREKVYPLPCATEQDMVEATLDVIMAAWAETYRDTITELWDRTQEDLLEQAKQCGEAIKPGILITVKLAVHTFGVRDKAPQPRSASISPPQHVERPQTPQRTPRVPRTPYTNQAPSGPGNYARRIQSANHDPGRGMLAVPPRTPTRSSRRRDIMPGSERPQRRGRYRDSYRPDYSMPPPPFGIKREIP
ncbi:hypothetical protein F5Y08DRAFT_350871 [Xylaria arbuscula]|nr:hypothetical protein F5Y08DRAFT_350871 [Xylaria arbuscula]